MMYNESEIIEEYLSGKNTKEIAVRLGTYNTTIRRILIRNNIKTRTISEINVTTNNNLIEGDKSISDYWIGYLAADGCLHSNSYRIELSCAEKDAEHIQHFADFVNCSVNKYLNKRFDTFTYRVSFRNKTVWEYLNSLGITPVKSKTIEYNGTMSFNFIRGVFDGDGYVRQKGREFQIASASEKFLQQIAYFLQQHNILCKINKQGNLFLLQVFKKEEYSKLFSMLYETDSVFLKRKYDIFKQNL